MHIGANPVRYKHQLNRKPKNSYLMGLIRLNLEFFVAASPRCVNLWLYAFLRVKKIRDCSRIFS